jgi:hypothetical protein
MIKHIPLFHRGLFPEQQDRLVRHSCTSVGACCKVSQMEVLLIERVQCS